MIEVISSFHRRSTLASILGTTLFFLGFLSHTGLSEAADQTLSGKETAPLTELVRSLQVLQSDPQGLEQAREYLSCQSQKTRQELDAVCKELADLKKKLAEAEARLGELTELMRPRTPETERPGSPSGSSVADQDPVSFNFEVRPILSNKCFACHGPDEKSRKAGLRFDTKEGAFGKLKSGRRAIVPGNRQESVLFQRITCDDPDDRMPPPSSEHCLTQEEIELLGRWIDQGAQWEKHWSFVPPKRPPLPEVKNKDWVKNEIDLFVLDRLEKEGLSPSPEAEKTTLIRRVTLDLTGLPPTLQEVDAFLADDSPDAYEKVVDRLLASPRYGEHMARYWLDLARYADTNGYHIDNERTMWPWRDWVIRAFNENKPFDEFTIEQIAGDLLPNPSLDQKVATGFNRNHMINFEGGAIPEEYHNEYVVDRVNTVGTTFLGMTVGCARCHDHKYDPISQKEYYGLYAFFNTIPEKGLDGREGNAVPFIRVPSPEHQKTLASLNEQIEEVRTEMYRPLPELDDAQREWELGVRKDLENRWTVLEPVEFHSTGGSRLEKQDDGSIFASGENPATDVYEVSFRLDRGTIQALRIEALRDDRLPQGGPGRSGNTNFVLTEVEATVVSRTPGGDTTEKVLFSLAKADHSQKDYPVSNLIDGDPKTGWAILGTDQPEDRTALLVFSDPVTVGDGSVLKVLLRQESGIEGHNIGRFRIAVSSHPSLQPTRLETWYVNGPYKADSGEKAWKTRYPPEMGVDLDETYEDGRVKWIAMEEYKDGVVHRLKGNVCATYLYRTLVVPSTRRAVLSVGSNDSIRIWLNGEVVHDNPTQRTVAPDQDEVTLHLKKGNNRLLMKIVDYGGDYGFYFRKKDEDVGEHPFEIEQIASLDRKARSQEQEKKIQGYYRSLHWPEWKDLDGRLSKLMKEKEAVEKAIPTTMVMEEMEEPRETFFLERGQYDQPREKVTASVPAAFPPLPKGVPVNRLGLARWLVDESNPLTARVTVNRYWQHYFGTGIVKTAEDFGSQGELPSHPELLDWLAREFIESGWDVKHMQRLIVTSATYRQSSRVRRELLECDPQNRLLARGPRFRLDAEVIRDNALAVSGLLCGKIGGPSVKPYQPEGLWEEVAYGAGFTAQEYVQGKGDDLYRRSMYTFWKRQCPPPSMLLFDAPNREVCTARRARTNTPLQALTLLNDPQFVEAARVLAQRMMTEGGTEPVDRIRYGFRLATARVPTGKECGILLETFRKQLEDYKNKNDLALELVSVGDSEPPENLDKTELAAWTTVAGMILNLDETITKG